MKSVAFLQEECIFQVDLLHIYIMKYFVNYFARAGLGGMNGLNPC